MEPAAIVFAGAFAPVLAELDDVLAGAVRLEIADEPALGTAYATAITAAADGPPDPAPLQEDDDADWIFTSGTTGNPKAVAITHAQSVACGHQAGPPFLLEPDSVYQSFAPFFTSTGCHTNLLGCLVAGCTYVVEPEFHVDDTLARMRRHGTTSIFLINTVMRLIFDRRGEDALAAGDFPALRRICYGAQPGGPDRRRVLAVGDRIGVELVNIYGLTESGNAGLMLVPEDQHEALRRRTGPYGMSMGARRSIPGSSTASAIPTASSWRRASSASCGCASRRRCRATCAPRRRPPPCAAATGCSPATCAPPTTRASSTTSTGASS